ncbi:MAG TPA: hypothetical protein VLJ83_05720, partial [Gemmatimonadaceae bacterium]|nr:hypothetical protein [Gemmatimonadaceae bacterium]
FSTTPRVSVQRLAQDLLVGGLATIDGTTFSRTGLPPGRYLVEAKAGAEVPHGGWLVVAQPDSTIFTLISPIGRQIARFSPLSDAEVFKTMLILRFRADIRAKPDVYGRDTLETVFRTPGDYVFTIGENLGTEYDEEDPNWHCTIRLSSAQ